MTTTSLETLHRLLQNLNQSGALELHLHTGEDGSSQALIPYMMNDALEYYIILENCRIIGDMNDVRAVSGEDGREEEDSCLPSARLIQDCSGNQARCALIVHVDPDRVFTVWFDDMQISCHCYRYHQIGHFWISGQEQWRRLVYILGTLHDKMQYLGPEFCNEAEQSLLPLCEFAPLIMWAPFHSQAAVRRLDRSRIERGCERMLQLSLEAGDTAYARLILLYRKAPFPALTKLLAQALTSPRRIPLYELLFKRIREASLAYPERDYGPERNALIAQEREDAAKQLLAQGFTGQYPLFTRGCTQILAMEEHPFTVLESDGFHFRIQFMVSECKTPVNGLNAGFFRKRGSCGSILAFSSETSYSSFKKESCCRVKRE